MIFLERHFEGISQLLEVNFAVIDGEEQRRIGRGHANACLEEIFELIFEAEDDFSRPSKTRRVADNRIETRSVVGASIEEFEGVFVDETVSLEIDVVLGEIFATAVKGRRGGVDARRLSDFW